MATFRAACQRANAQSRLGLARVQRIRRWSKPDPSCRMLSSTTTSTASRRILPVTSNLQDFRKLIDNSNRHSTRKEQRPLSSEAVTTSSDSPLDDPLLLVDIEDIDGVDRELLRELASQRPTPLRLADMYKYGTSTDLDQRLRNAQFLHKELQIRIAQRAIDLLTLPHGLSEATPIRHVAKIFLQYLQKFQDLPAPTTAEEEEAFTDMLQGLVLDRTSIPMDIARGVSAWRRDGKCEDLELERLQEMEDALYRFFTARVGLRFLIEHHVLSSARPSAEALRNVTHVFSDDNDDKERGCIQANCDLVKETTRVAELVRQQTQDYYGMCPEIEIVDCMSKENKMREFTYVPHHLHYMLGELLKNSCRATVRHTLSKEFKGKHHQEELPPIRVIIVKGEEDVTIKIADKGGGIPRSLMCKIWKFAHSTADEEESQTDFGKDELSGARIRGFGLPLARIYARYFGGELTLKSTEGYGVDAYLHLPRLGTSGESLPLRVRASPGERDSTAKQVRSFSTSATAARHH